MLKERGKWFQISFNIPNILENSQKKCWMDVEAKFKGF